MRMQLHLSVVAPLLLSPSLGCFLVRLVRPVRPWWKRMNHWRVPHVDRLVIGPAKIKSRHVTS